jgi:4-hydroxy-tetrahydrodipicolinate synthase
MNPITSRLVGTGVALITPFEHGEIDFRSLDRMIDHVINGGVEYIVSLGSTGESATLDLDERRKLLDRTIARVNGRVPIVAGNFGENNTRDLCKYAESFDFAGIDAILSSSPAYNKPTQEGIYRHYKALSEASSVPVILYNVPGRTASNVTAETTLRLAHDFPSIIAIKEASGDIVQGSKIIMNKPEGFLVISGDDPTALPLIALGGQGVISVIANAYPAIFSSMVRLALSGNIVESRRLHEAMLNIHPVLYVEGNPAGIKAATTILGLSTPEVRLPLTSLSKERTMQLHALMDALEAG